MNTKQELLMEQHCECRVCGHKWVVAKARVYQFELSCCGWVSVREVPGQLLFSDAGGAWIRRRAA